MYLPKVGKKTRGSQFYAVEILHRYLCFVDIAVSLNHTHCTPHISTGCVCVCCMWHIDSHIHTRTHKCTYILSSDYIICYFSHMSCEVQACACFRFRNILNEFWPIRKIRIHLHIEALFTHTHIHAVRHTEIRHGKSRRVNEKEQMMSETDRPIEPFTRK